MVPGAPVMAGEAVHRALRDKKTALEQAIGRLSLLPAHDALCLLKNSIAMPKLPFTLRSSPCSGSPVLTEFDNALRCGLSQLLNVDLSDAHAVATGFLPVYKGGLGVRSACMLAPSAFLASAAATLPLQEAILAPSIQSSNTEDHAVTEALETWHTMTDAAEPADASRRVQRAWDEQIADSLSADALSPESPHRPGQTEGSRSTPRG